MQKVYDFIHQYNMIEAEDKVIVGVSGGADSVCLLFVLYHLQKQISFEMKVVHIEHGVRGEESRQDAEFVKGLCAQWQIPCIIRSFDVPQIALERKISVEEAGRMARYQAFEEAGMEWGNYKIAVAHNQNDQAETMIWNMVRGSGLTGAGGIRPVRGNVIRPLLSTNRKEIEGYLAEHHISWREDATNQEMVYTRNSIRHKILPVMEEDLNGSSVQHLALLGEELQRTDAFLNRLTEQAMNRMAIFSKDKVQIVLKDFRREDSLIQERVLRKCLEKAGCGLRDLGRIHIRQILEMMDGQSGRKINLPGGWKAGKSFEHLYLELSEKKKEQEKIVLESRIFSYNHENIPQKKYTKWLDYDKIKCGLCLRTRQPGDYLVVDQKGSKKKLKAYLIEEKIPAQQREHVYLAASGSEILWVIGHRINEAYKVQPDTKNILELKLQGREE